MFVLIDVWIRPTAMYQQSTQKICQKTNYLSLNVFDWRINADQQNVKRKSRFSLDDYKIVCGKKSKKTNKPRENRLFFYILLILLFQLIISDKIKLFYDGQRQNNKNKSNEIISPNRFTTFKHMPLLFLLSRDNLVTNFDLIHMDYYDT